MRPYEKIHTIRDQRQIKNTFTFMFIDTAVSYINLNGTALCYMADNLCIHIQQSFIEAYVSRGNCWQLDKIVVYHIPSVYSECEAKMCATHEYINLN